jgi:membrane associated rhomboid family serine protease
MTVRSFPRTRDKPQKRILLVPILLMFGGWGMTSITILQFLGTIIALTGALTTFLVGAVYADLWASHRRTQKMIKDRQKEGFKTPEEDIDKPIIEDPFEETYDGE